MLSMLRLHQRAARFNSWYQQLHGVGTHDAPEILQVAKDLLDTAMKSPPRPQAPSIDASSLADLAVLLQLLTFRCCPDPCQAQALEDLEAGTGGHMGWLTAACFMHICCAEDEQMAEGESLDQPDSLEVCVPVLGIVSFCQAGMFEASIAFHNANLVPAGSRL